MHTHLSISARGRGGGRAPNAAAVQDRGGLYGMDETKNDREIQRKVMPGSLLPWDQRGRLENPRQPGTRISALTRVSGGYLVHDHPLRSGAGAATGGRAAAATPAAPARGSTKREDKDSLTVGSRTAVRRLARRGEDKDSPAFLIFPRGSVS